MTLENLERYIVNDNVEIRMKHIKRIYVPVVILSPFIGGKQKSIFI